MNPPKEILILSLGRRGGSVRYGKSIIDQFVEIPKQVFVSKYCMEEIPNHAIKIPTYRNKIEFIFSSSTFLVFFWLYILWGLFRGRYIALYTPYTHYWNIVFLLSFKAFGLKTASTVHDGIPHTGEGNWWERLINYSTLRKSDHLIFLTEHVQRFLKSKIGFKAKSTVIPHGLLEIKGIQLKKRKLIKPLKLLFLGRVCHYKGIDLLIESMSKFTCDEIQKVTISGEISSDQRHLMELKSPIPLVWRDHWLSESEMANDLNQADLLILPYRESTQSGVASIGFFSGIPMVCTRTGGLVEQCDDQDTVLVDPTPKSIADGIKTLLNHSERYEEIQENMSLKRKILTWESISDQVISCIIDQ